MKKPPCARFGMRISPKASEKPDERRNSRPPKAMLLSVWMIQNCMSQRILRSGSTPLAQSLQILRRRIIARVDRVLQELVLAVGPELADVRIGLHDRVDELAEIG